MRFIVNISVFAYIHSASSIQCFKKSNFKIDWRKKKDSPDPGPERIKGKKAKESKNKDLRSGSEFTALFVAALRLSGEITTYFKHTRRNQEKRNRYVGAHCHGTPLVISASGSQEESCF